MDPKISGLYKEVFSTPTERKTKGTELELRVDVDGNRPMNVISGDLHSNKGRIRKYLSSFRFERVKKAKTAANEILITGKLGKFDPDSDHFTDIQVIIPPNSHPLKATVQWIDNLGTASRCLCKYKSKYLRSVQLEHDYEKGVVPFELYDSIELSFPFSQRSHPLSVIDAFAEAGIEIIIAEKKLESVPSPKMIPKQGSLWTDSQLYDAMLKHFSMLKDKPQWKVWLFSALEYAISDFRGITLFHKGKRTGCAVFQNATGWQKAQEKRMRLFVYVHELGHCFNLQHPWNRPQDEFSTQNDYSTLSWMNLPWRYYSSEEFRGEEAFWKVFNFQFSDSELIHLRHGFRNDVILGGNTFSKEIESKSLL